MSDVHNYTRTDIPFRTHREWTRIRSRVSTITLGQISHSEHTEWHRDTHPVSGVHNYTRKDIPLRTHRVAPGHVSRLGCPQLHGELRESRMTEEGGRRAQVREVNNSRGTSRIIIRRVTARETGGVPSLNKSVVAHIKKYHPGQTEG